MNWTFLCNFWQKRSKKLVGCVIYQHLKVLDSKLYIYRCKFWKTVKIGAPFSSLMFHGFVLSPIHEKLTPWNGQICRGICWHTTTPFNAHNKRHTASSKKQRLCTTTLENTYLFVQSFRLHRRNAHYLLNFWPNWLKPSSNPQFWTALY